MKIPGVRTLTTNYEILGGPATALVIAASTKFREANPKIYKAFYDALNEAINSINSDKRAAAKVYLEQAKDTKNSVDDIYAMISAADYALHADAAEGRQDRGLHVQDRYDQDQAGVVEGPVLSRGAEPAGRLNMRRRRRVRIGSGAGFVRRSTGARGRACRARRHSYLGSNASPSARSRSPSCSRRRDPAQRLRPVARAPHGTAVCRCSSGTACRLITNFGAANPVLRQASASSRSHGELRVPINVAVVTGDDVLRRISPARSHRSGDGRPLADYGELVSANAYLGADALLPALAIGRRYHHHGTRRGSVAVRRADRASIRLAHRRSRLSGSRRRRRPSARMRRASFAAAISPSRDSRTCRTGARRLSLRRGRCRRQRDSGQGDGHRRVHHRWRP